jgi:hypothetical protein
MLCVGEGDPTDQHISNNQTTWQLSAGDEKTIPAKKSYILWDIAYSIPYLHGSYSIPGIDFSPQYPSKNVGSGSCSII